MKFANKKIKYIFSKGYFYKINNKFIVCIEDKYYLLNNISKVINNEIINIKYEKKRKNIYIFILGIISLILMIVNFINYFNIKNNIYNLNYFLILFFMIVITFIIHELGHIITMLYYNKKPGKITPTMVYYLFPGIKVDVTKSLELTPFERINVNLGGVFFASFLINVLYFYKFNINILNILTLNTIMSVFPIYKSDGYNAILSLFGIYEYKNKKNKLIFFVKILTTIVFVIYFILLFDILK